MKGLNPNKHVYLLYRITDENDIGIYKGWTQEKFTIKGLLKQRDPKKYKVIKYDSPDDVPEQKFLEDDWKINIVYIAAIAAHGEKIPLYMTSLELIGYETSIEKMFDAQASLSNIKNEDLLNEAIPIYRLYNDKYYNALREIGYSPAEDYYDFGEYELREEYKRPNSTFSEVIYSLESFLAVMAKDM